LTSIIETRDLQYSYPGGKQALDGISFQVMPGESVALLGANASGKSTLLHLLDGLYFANHGQVEAFGTALTEESVDTPPFSRRLRQGIGFLFQNSDAQLFNTTVEEELAFGPRQLRLSADEVETRVGDTLRLFELEQLRQRSPQSLSGGEKKKVALAGLITCGPEVILLDEPSSGLDPRTQQWLNEFLQMLNEDMRVTLITASHDLSFVGEIADRAMILSEDHKLVFDGPSEAALSDLDLLLSVNLIHSHTHVHDGEIHEHPHLHEAWHNHQHGKKR
jgi:cobalt/nickel transport system ATP-binding protein